MQKKDKILPFLYIVKNYKHIPNIVNHAKLCKPKIGKKINTQNFKASRYALKLFIRNGIL